MKLRIRNGLAVEAEKKMEEGIEHTVFNIEKMEIEYKCLSVSGLYSA